MGGGCRRRQGRGGCRWLGNVGVGSGEKKGSIYRSRVYGAGVYGGGV